MTRLQQLWLLGADVDAALPWACVPLVLWLLTWALRRRFPKVWEWFASKGPLGRKFRKVWQAIPSALGGTILVSVSFDWQTTDLCLASLVSLAAPLWHELLRSATAWLNKRLPWVPVYYGGIWPAAGQSIPPSPRARDDTTIRPPARDSPDQ